ncbi:MAG TPA: FkbM family methyltransferase [Longimicrobiaceae bacterium]|nr:FkbM family methyltransferase [Longimicrobiaceae bacterium]
MNAEFEYGDFKAVLSLAPTGLKYPKVLPLYDNLLTDVPRDGVIHLGAHVGQEVHVYTMLGFRRALMVEPLPEEFEILEERCSTMMAFMQAQRDLVGRSPRPPVEFRCVRCAASDQAGVATFYRTEWTQLSGLTPPEEDLPDARFQAVAIEVETRTLDDIVQSLGDGWDTSDFTYLRMNIQGAELMALRGAENVLKNLKAILLEVSLDSRYEGQPGKEEFDAFLGPRGFECTFGCRLGPVGNLLYQRK